MPAAHYWDELEDAYGKAGGIPDLLNEAFRDKASKSDTQSGPWFDLWSRLCHQGSIYSASYAAVPKTVEAIKKVEGPIAMDFFLLPVSIELARHNDNALPLPDDLSTDCLSAIRELGGLVNKYTDADDVYLRKAAEAARLASLGQIAKASELIDA
jgi:hypothetical protein